MAKIIEGIKQALSPYEMLKEVILFGVAPGILDGIKNGIKGTTAQKIEEEIKNILDRHRVQVISYWREDLNDQEASDNLLRRQVIRQRCIPPYVEGDEDDYMRMSAKVFLALKAHPEKLQAMFIWLGKMTDSEFDVMLEAFRDDGLKQKALAVVKSITKRLSGFDQSFEQKNDDLRQKIAAEKIRQGRQP